MLCRQVEESKILLVRVCLYISKTLQRTTYSKWPTSSRMVTCSKTSRDPEMVVTSICLGPSISKTAGDTDLVTMEYLYELTT